MNEAAKILGEALFDAIREVVREQILALNGHQDSPGGSSKPKITAKDRYLTPNEIAAKLGISRSSVRRMIIDGQLHAVCMRAGKRKKKFCIRESALERWLKKLESRREIRAGGTSATLD